ncbi:hypothetical protein GCM10027431_18560 [Lysobacter rhizosphaerae]
MKSGLSVCLVTEELSGVGGSGGIGAAFFELAVLLASKGALVDVLYCPVAPLPSAEIEQIQARFSAKSIKFVILDESKYVDGSPSYEKRSYAICRHLEECPAYDYVHFHDYKGLGFFATSAKKQGLSFADSTLVVQLHGPTRWTMDANSAFFCHEDQLVIDHLERGAIRNADHVVSPSAYLVDWLNQNGFELPAPDRVHVIKNVCTEIVREGGRLGPVPVRKADQVTDLVLFARHEDRKGFATFCDALDIANDVLAGKNVTVSFMGKMGAVDGQPSGVYLVDRCKRWTFNYRTRTGLDRSGAAQYIRSLGAPVAVVPSPYENSPYTVLEAVVIGVPLIASNGGGGPELVEPGYAGLCEITADALAEKIVWAVQTGELQAPLAGETLKQIEEAWIDFHVSHGATAPSSSQGAKPKVAFAITHFERADKVVDAIISAARQTYKNMEILVVDDGSSKPETLEALAQVEVFLSRMGGRLIRRTNGYLGAARNTALAATDAEYICFLDDDDYAFPELIETLVGAALATGADVVNCMNVFMPESRRAKMTATRDRSGLKVSYVPSGGPLSVAATQNCLGAATALIRTAALRDVGGYTELKGVGHEDYELFLRMVQAGKSLQIVPRPLYLYEVGRPSMLSKTSMQKNFRRCFDSTDLSNDSRATNDLHSLTLGKKLQVDIHNRQWWLYSQQKTAELRHQVLANPHKPRQELLPTLIKLAQAEGCVRMATAFVEDLGASGMSAELDELVPVISRVQVQIGLGADAALAGIKLEGALGRAERAMMGLNSYVTSTPALGARFFEVANEILAVTNAAQHRELYASLLNTLSTARMSRSVRPMAQVFMTALEIASGSAVDMARIGEMLGEDERSYLALNEDVARAFDAGTVKSALDHYREFGVSERRRGFERLSQIAGMLGGCNAGVGEFELIEMMAEAKAA